LAMGEFVKSEHYKKLHVGFALDEGIANTGEEFTVFYGERAIWWLKVIATGPTGHGSRFVKDTAVQKLLRCCNRFLDLRAEQEKKLEGHSGCKDAMVKKLELGDVVTLNLTALKAGVTNDGGKTFAINVVPTEAEACFDIRIPPDVDLQEFESKIRDWTKEDDVSYEFISRCDENPVTSLDRAKNQYWAAFADSCKRIGVKIDTQIFPAATDGRYLRIAGLPVLGFSPINHTPVLLHDHNERLNRQVFLRGVQVYEELLPDLANSEF